MTRIQARFRTIVARYGEPLGGAPAVVTSLTPQKARSYATDAEIDAAGRPLWVAYAGYDHPATEGGEVTYGARTLTVRRTIEVRYGGATVARLLVLFPAG